MKIGHGFDVHAFVENRDFIIGGVKIDFHLGLSGHSDADVLIHAICDSILGALSMGDIGKHFPDTDMKYKNINSREFLLKIQELLRENYFKIGNIDCTIICQNPKLSPYILDMKKNISQDLSCDLDQINIKATTTEKLGFIGRGDGVAAEAVCLLEEIT
ncbi:MAG: 2-C-methyl-D-erythritol 2,4-cyclodiphosphate synthase [Nitrosomonadales bacterium]|jgi:2-C-methyl-D-erythritol 2,4-cyclodiphosphate synthase